MGVVAAPLMWRRRALLPLRLRLLRLLRLKLFCWPLLIALRGVPVWALLVSVAVQSLASIGHWAGGYHSAVRLRPLLSALSVTWTLSAAEVIVALSGSDEVSKRSSATETGL